MDNIITAEELKQLTLNNIPKELVNSTLKDFEIFLKQQAQNGYSSLTFVFPKRLANTNKNADNTPYPAIIEEKYLASYINSAYDLTKIDVEKLLNSLETELKEIGYNTSVRNYGHCFEITISW